MSDKASSNPLQKLYRRPGFLIRRAHQIAVSLFAEEMQPFAITKTQYGILFILEHRAGINQTVLGKLLGLDRSTTSMVVKKLMRDGLVTWNPASDDQRERILSLTRSGRAMLGKVSEIAARSERRILDIFTKDEQEQFIALLQKFTGAFNLDTRVPAIIDDQNFAPTQKVRNRGLANRAR